jgi:integrase
VFLTLRRERLRNLPFSTNLLNDQKDHVTSQDLHEFSQVLKDQKRRQEENPIVDPEEWPEAVDLVFVTELGRPVNVNSLVYKHFKPVLKRSGLPNIRLYDLRHTVATLALTVGVSPKVVSEQLGHTSAAFTLDVYSHVLPHMQEDAVAKVEAALMG